MASKLKIPALRGSKRRFAFVLGNSTYGKFGALPNATRDADEIARKLTELDFEVDLQKDLGPGEIIPAFDKFRERVKAHRNVDTVAIYYAGHGFQENGSNYILSVPNEEGDIAELPVLNMVAPFKATGVRRLLFFDACRNLDTDAVEQSLARTRDFTSGNRPRIRVGLSDARADYGTETVLSFSAAPGKKALDEIEGGSELSPYASALASHIGSIDLPLMNILGRVHEDVKAATGNKQETWTGVALGQPYYFNPSSLLFLTGNLMAFVAFFVALATAFTAFLMLGYAQAKGHSTSGALLYSSLVVVGIAFAALLYGMSRAYKRARGARLDEDKDFANETATPLHGAVGGVLGGLASAPLITILFWQDWRQTPQWGGVDCKVFDWLDPVSHKLCPKLPVLLIEISLAGVFIAAMLGWLAVVYSNKFRAQLTGWAAYVGSNGRLLLGAVLGGTLAGTLCGPPVTAYFGSFDRPFLDPSFVMAFAIISVAIIAFSIVNYSLDHFTKDRFKRSVIAAGSATVIAALALAPLLFGLAQFDFVQGALTWAHDGYWNESYSVPRRFSYLLVAGLPYGFVFGLCLGLLIGITRMLTEPWDGWKLLPERETSPANALKGNTHG